MNQKTRNLILIAAGALLVLASLGADVIGLGAHPDFGWKQITGLAVGTGIAVAGALGLKRG